MQYLSGCKKTLNKCINYYFVKSNIKPELIICLVSILSLISVKVQKNN
jgi:hypothetical protein